jgi:hypothetical protein
LQRRSRPEQSDQRQPNQAANIFHQPRASPDSTSLAIRIEFPTMTPYHGYQFAEQLGGLRHGWGRLKAALTLNGRTSICGREAAN